MEIDRWVVPPAVAAAVFAVTAIAPPVSREGVVDGLRVEVLGPVRADGMALARVAIQRVSDDSLRAPRRGSLEAVDASGRVTARARAAAYEGSEFLVGRVEAPRASRFVLRVTADGRAASVSLPVMSAEVAANPRARVEEVDLAATAGVLLPEQRGEVLVRVPGAAEVRLEPEFEGVSVAPAAVAPGACDVAAFQVSVSGLGAPVAVVARMRDGTGKRWDRRLPVRAGGLSLLREGDEVVVRGTLSGQRVHLAGGAGSALRWWTGVALVATSDGGEARVPLPPDGGLRWVRASLDARFEEEHDSFVRWDGATEPCATDEASRRWFAARATAPVRPELRVVFDGAARARATLSARVDKARDFALGCLVAAVLLESVLVLGLGLRRDDGEPDEVMRTRRERIGPLLAGVALLLLVGFALGLTSIVGARMP